MKGKGKTRRGERKEKAMMKKRRSTRRKRKRIKKRREEGDREKIRTETKTYCVGKNKKKHTKQH